MRILGAILVAGLVFCHAVPAEADKGAQLFNGSYDWTDGGSDELTAKFRPAKDGSWKVEFTFRFSGKQKTWKGAATGSLDEGGSIDGEVEWSGRNWVFEATVEAGVLRGSHTEIQRGGERYSTGTFELNR